MAYFVRLAALGTSLLFGAMGASVYAQEASVVGTVTDDTKAVLPGATVTAIGLETGLQTVAASDTGGQYRLLLAPGVYKVQAELSGFTTVVLSKVELLVGQNSTVNFAMKVATVNETLTVVGEAPLVDFTSSQIAGNVDRRQMEGLPIQGRNWMELSKMVKGITANNVDDRPGVNGDNFFQLNLDGQQVTQKKVSTETGAQPGFSREAIAEFQIVTNMFDVTMGRSVGIQVQAITKSGTNTNSGSLFGYFRNDKLNAPDLVAGTVLPYSNQQVGGTFGGPIIRDKTHYFVSYEYEREPTTIVSSPPQLPGQTFVNSSKSTQKSLMVRGDTQLSTNDRLTIRGSTWRWGNPFVSSGAGHPSNAINESRRSANVLGTWSKVIGGGSRVQEVRFGWTSINTDTLPQPSMVGTPQYSFPGLIIGAPYNHPSFHASNALNFGYSLNWHKGRHDIKVGGEYIRGQEGGTQDFYRWGLYSMTSVPANLSELIPASAALDQSQWNLLALNSFVRAVEKNYSNTNFENVTVMPRPLFTLWFGDTWRATDRLTLTLGVRWDGDPNHASPPDMIRDSIPIDGGVLNGDFGHNPDIRNMKNLAPRAGFTYNVGGRNNFAIRGGTGLFYGMTTSSISYGQRTFTNLLAASFVPDGRANFILDPSRGVTGEDYFSGSVPLPRQATRVTREGFSLPYTWQSSIGFQKQIGAVTGIDVDLTHFNQYRDIQTFDVNLFFDPATGYQKNPATAGRPNPAYEQVLVASSTGYSSQTQLETGVNRRLHNRLQAGGTYTLMLSARDSGGFSFTNSNANNVFDLDDEEGPSVGLQRHTARAWVLYALPWGFSTSVAYFYGSGNPLNVTIAGTPYGKLGQNRLNLTNTGGSAATIVVPAEVADRFDGPTTIPSGMVIPRRALLGLPLHKVDLRLTKDIGLGGRRRVSLMAEVFNLFNHANFGSYNTQLSATNPAVTARFGQPVQNGGTAYVPRSGQLGLRFGF